jgi:opacity protein-like surface antigen
MFRRLSVLTTAVAIIVCGTARAQDVGSGSQPGPGLVEVTVIPAGAGFFSSKHGSPSFGNYGFGSSVTYNINRVIGVEGEFGAMIATTSGLQFGDLNHHTKAPNFLNYNVNAIVTAATFGPARVYGAGGIGGLTMFERAGLGVTGDTTFFVGNVGGGVKWYAPNSRWGLRGDYRFLVNRSNDTAPSFFGTDSRYAHRLYAGVIINAR